MDNAIYKLENEALRAKARGLLERNTERPFFILALKGKVFWPRMYKDGLVIMTLIISSITHDDSIQLKKAFASLLEEGSKNIILDLSNTFYVSSIVLASLVFMQKSAKEAGGNLVICGVNDRVREVLEMANLDKVLDIVTDRQETNW